MIRKVAVLGYYGHRNFGDELILAGLRQLFKPCELVVFQTNHHLDYESVNACDLFVLGGGELINTHSLFGRHSRWQRSWVKHIIIPKVILGCGVNCETPTAITPGVKNDLERFSYIGVRDHVSLDILLQIPRLAGKVHLFHDLALSLDLAGATWKPEGHVAVVIPTDRFTRKHDRGIRCLNIVRASRSWLSNNLATYDNTVFLAFGAEDNDDYLSCQQLAHGNSEILSVEHLTLDKVVTLMAHSAKVFTYRLHGLLLSFLVGVPYDFYPYHWKLQRVHDTIKHRTVEAIQAQQKSRFKEMLENVV